MVIGENQKFLCAFITFKVDVDMAKGIPSNNLTIEARNFFKNTLNVEVKTSDEACANDKIQKFIEQCTLTLNLFIDSVNDSHPITKAVNKVKPTHSQKIEQCRCVSDEQRILHQSSKCSLTCAYSSSTSS
jgi:hypothetical protein